jgi:hypothetical protein
VHYLRVKLHALDRERPVPHTHDLAILRLGGDREACRNRLALDDQRVVARRSETIRDFREHALAIVADARDLAVHHVLRPHHFAAERLADRLVAQAHAQDRDLPGQAPEQLEGDSGLGRRARPGRNHDAPGIQQRHLIHRGLVVAQHFHLRAELAQVLHQVVGERIVVVDHTDHRLHTLKLFRVPSERSRAP